MLGRKCTEKPDLTVASQGECQKQKTKLNPVCGSDGITYPNVCVLEDRKCKEKPDLTVASQGKCQKQG